MDYVSNRIFDVLQADCIPIYWGAPNITDYVDPATMVNRANFSSNQELAEYLQSVTENEFEEYRGAISRYINGNKIKAFFSEKFIDNIVATLGL